MLFYRRTILSCGVALFSAAGAHAAPPTDPEALKIYTHDYKWLENAQINFVAANMRGADDSQYRERRQAALDIIRKKHDLTTVPELTDELQRRSFLSAEICEILGEWNAKKALPLLKEVAADSKRPPEVRQSAQKAIDAMKSAAPEAPPPRY